MIHIVCNIDQNYIEQCGVMLTSLFIHNTNTQFSIHIINNGLSNEGTTKIKTIANNSLSNIYFYKTPQSLTENFPIKAKDYLSIATYLRIFMSELLPADIEKALYLDCDLLITDSIEDLWNTDMDNYAVAALKERPPFDTEFPSILGYPIRFSYFNAGVMLVNLKRWREINVAEQCKNFISTNYNKIKYHDQDVLNAILHEEVLFIDLRWNIMDFFLTAKPNIQDERIPELRLAIKNPAIIHFAGPKKPWSHKCDNPFRKQYVQLAKQFHWDVINTKTDIRYHLRNILYKIFTFLHLKKKKILTLSELYDL